VIDYPPEDRRYADADAGTPADALPAADDPDAGEGGSGAEGGGRPSQATQLVRLAQERYVLLAAADGRAFAVPVDGHIVRDLRGGRGSLRAELAASYFKAEGRAPTASALADALSVLEGEAEATERRVVALRVAAHDGGIVLDLGRADGSVVHVTPNGWTVRTESPVLFRRTELTGPLPVPSRDGNLDALRQHLNVTESDWPLIVGWLVAALFETIPHAILSLVGEQGVGKTTAAKVLVRTVDPSPAPVRSAPRDVEAWALTASGGWIVALDNLSAVPDWLSDALCRGATGDGFVRRTLYTSDGLSVTSFRRPIILTTIDAGALNGDLAERMLTAELDRINKANRRLDAELADAFDADHPAILGGLLDLAVDVLRVLPDVRPDDLPRMADFALVLAAVDRVKGWRSFNSFLGVSDRLASATVEDDPVAARINALVTGTWSGTATDLLAALDAGMDEDTRRRLGKRWPSSARGIAERVKRLAPALRSVGLEVEYERDSGAKRSRTYTFTRRPDKDGTTPSGPSAPSERPADVRNHDAAAGHHRPAKRPTPPNRPSDGPPPDVQERLPLDGSDGPDGWPPVAAQGSGVRAVPPPARRTAPANDSEPTFEEALQLVTEALGAEVIG
jgi:hypothetical protein